MISNKWNVLLVIALLSPGIIQASEKTRRNSRRRGLIVTTAAKAESNKHHAGTSQPSVAPQGSSSATVMPSAKHDAKLPAPFVSQKSKNELLPSKTKTGLMERMIIGYGRHEYIYAALIGAATFGAVGALSARNSSEAGLLRAIAITSTVVGGITGAIAARNNSLSTVLAGATLGGFYTLVNQKNPGHVAVPRPNGQTDFCNYGTSSMQSMTTGAVCAAAVAYKPSLIFAGMSALGIVDISSRYGINDYQASLAAGLIGGGVVLGASEAFNYTREALAKKVGANAELEQRTKKYKAQNHANATAAAQHDMRVAQLIAQAGR